MPDRPFAEPRHAAMPPCRHAAMLGLTATLPL
jgi:hypothetical protein